MAPTFYYNTVPQLGHHDTTEHDQEAPSSPASAAATSTMTFLSLAETAFTPLSMDSSGLSLPSTDEDENAGADDEKGREEEGQKEAREQHHERDSHVQLEATFGGAVPGASTATTTSQLTPPPTRATSRAHAPPRGRPELLLPASQEMRCAPPRKNKRQSPISPAPSTSRADASADRPPAPPPHRDILFGGEEGSSGIDSILSRRSEDLTLAHARQPFTTATRDPARDGDKQTAVAIVRPHFTNKARHHAQAQVEDHPPPSKPAIVRTTSSRGRLPLRHPAPDLNVRSGAYAGNIAQLEASAERLSMTSSIEDAIREAHQELKRSDSQRSSILAASVKSAPRTDDGSSQLPTVARRSSILEVNSAARSGGYSPSGYTMSPSDSLSSSRPRAESKGGGGGGLASVPDGPGLAGDEFNAALSRHGAGKSSVRSMQSGMQSLPEIVEVDNLPMTLTQEALDEADRIMATGEDHDDDDTIRASAHQHVDLDFDTGFDVDFDQTPQVDQWPDQPMLDHAAAPKDYMGYRASQPPLGNPADYTPYQPGYEHHQHARPTSSASGATFEQAQVAFGDFDGVHCDPDNVDFSEMRHGHAPEQPRLSRPGPRPTTYIDPATGNQMLYYPAKVPAMLNLPQKLSKKPKTTERNARMSRVLNAMPQAARETRIWLPDPVGDDLGSPFLDIGSRPSSSSQPSQPSPALVEHQQLGDNSEASVAEQSQPDVRPLSQFRRPPRLSETEKRKSRMTLMNGLPPQLRASAFFDLPSTAPQVEVKNGSATDTLESILDAAASAPVSAFTDHAFAGKLGSEVYGIEKKRKKKKKASADITQLHTSAVTTSDEKKRSTFFSLMGHGRKNSEPLAAAADRRTVIGVDGALEDDLRDGFDGELVSPTSEGVAAALAPDEDEEGSSEEEDEDEEEDVYHGPPTTLLAELQIRKQQQKMRTRPVNKAFPNGMHSTLLDLDTVAEIERKSRKGKKVNLAWEEPTLNPDEDSDGDEDVPLGMLFAAKAAGNNDISAVAAEINRPLGLMQKKDLEENEPLSRRRDRLQGRDAGVSVYLGAGLGANGFNKRGSTLTLTPTIAALNSGGQISSGQPSPRIVGPEESDGEIEGETLADRRRRLKEKEESELPQARPVSTAFSAELLTQFCDAEEDSKAKGRDEADRGKENAPPEEEETLGQRRRRLQAEKEARDREMSASGGGLAVNGTALHALTGSDRLSKRLSMADMLGAHPRGLARGAMDPREQERLRREEEAVRAVREKEHKMAGFRDQVPLAMPSTSLGGGVAKPGGFSSGRFNDGTGGGVGGPATMHADGPGAPVAKLGGFQDGRFNDGTGGGVGARATTFTDGPGTPLIRVGGFQDGRFNDGTGGGVGVRATTFADGPGTSMAKPSGYQGGRFNDGMGGNRRTVTMSSLGGYGGMQQPAGMNGYPVNGMQPPVGMNGGSYGNGYPVNGLGGMPLQMGMGVQMGQQPPGQLDMVERWRQGVHP